MSRGIFNIKITYHGFDGAAGAGLRFLDNGTIQVDRIYGILSIKGDTTKMYEPLSRGALNPDWRDSLFESSYNFNNIVVAFDYIEAEQKKNKEHHSKVKAIYQKKRSIGNIFY